MTLLVLPNELLLRVISFAVQYRNRTPVPALLLPCNRQTPYVQDSQAYHGMERDACLTPHAPPTALVLSGQATVCADRRGQGSPPLVQLSHVCGRIRRLILTSPLLWADDALCVPAEFHTILRRTKACPLVFICAEGICACVFSDIRASLWRASEIHLILPSLFIRCDNAVLATSDMLRNVLTHSIHLTEIELRLDSHCGDARIEKPLPYLLLQSIRSVRLQNVPFVVAGPRVEIMHLSAEPGAMTFPMEYLLRVICNCPRLRILALQSIWDGRDWIKDCQVALPYLEHFTCSGERTCAPAFLYAVRVPTSVDLYIDSQYDLGSLPDAETAIPRMLNSEICVLLNPAATRAMMDFAIQARANGTTESFTPEDFAMEKPRPLPVLALTIAPDYEATSPFEMWPLYVSLCFAPDRVTACRALSPYGDPVSHGEERQRRAITLRNNNAAFPGDHVAAREALPRDRRPSHLADAASYLIIAYTDLSYEGDHITDLVFDRASWVPEDEVGWLYLLSDLDHIQHLEVLGQCKAASIKSLALYLAHEGQNEDLEEIAFRSSGMSFAQTSALRREVQEITANRDIAEARRPLRPISWAVC